MDDIIGLIGYRVLWTFGCSFIITDKEAAVERNCRNNLPVSLSFLCSSPRYSFSSFILSFQCHLLVDERLELFTVEDGVCVCVPCSHNLSCSSRRLRCLYQLDRWRYHCCAWMTWGPGILRRWDHGGVSIAWWSWIDLIQLRSHGRWFGILLKNIQSWASMPLVRWTTFDGKLPSTAK